MLLIMFWFYYSKYFIIGSLFITYILNRITKKLYLPPLIINMVSLLLLLPIPVKDREYALIAGYIPVVLSSVIMNMIIYVYKKIVK